MSGTVEQLDLSEVRPLHRELNKTLMVSWINQDLLHRFDLDVRKSVVLYDEFKDFVYAVPELPDEDTLTRLRRETGVRFWSQPV